jgi:curved DNA-binding protein CbpA
MFGQDRNRTESIVIAAFMQDFEEDYYGILGVEESAAPDEIKKAYLKLAKKLHPDKHPNDAEERARAQREFARVTRAHDIISDSERRAEYDAVRILKKKKEMEEESVTIVSEDIIDPDSGERIKAVRQTSTSTSLQGISTDETINVKWANKHLGRADDLLKRRRYQEAEVAIKEAIRLVPRQARYHNKLAEIYHARGWNTLAMTEVQTALRAEPRDSEARNLEARIKASIKEQEATRKSTAPKKSIFQQIKEILTKKL